MNIVDYLTQKCKEAGHTDPEFIEAARFGAKALNDRLVSDWADSQHQEMNSVRHCTIWRNPTTERPKNFSTIVLRNAAMITYAHYENGYCYYDGFCDQLANFVGKWCYKSDLWGVTPDSPYYEQVF